MTSKLRMDFAPFYKKNLNLFLNKELSGYIGYDLGELFQMMVYDVLPEKLPENYYYDSNYFVVFENGREGTSKIGLNRIHNNYPSDGIWLYLKTGYFDTTLLDEKELKIANDYFFQPIREIVCQMEQYYQNRGIEQHGKIVFSEVFY